MTRRLTFDGPKAQERFRFCVLSVLCSGDGKGPRNREVLRKEARLLDAFDAISVPDEKVVQVGRMVTPDAVVTLEQDDFTLLQSYMDTCAWLSVVAREAVDAQDFVDSAEKID